MMGERTVVQEALFYGFSLERHVPSVHGGDKTGHWSVGDVLMRAV